MTRKFNAATYSASPSTSNPATLTGCTLSIKRKVSGQWIVGALLSSIGACCAGVYACKALEPSESEVHKQWVVKICASPSHIADLLFKEYRMYSFTLKPLMENKMIPSLPPQNKGYDECLLSEGGEKVRYLVMERMDKTWNDNSMLLEDCNGATGVNSIIRIANEVVTILEKLHSLKVIYFDIKPDNIMLNFDGSVCLLDFGVAAPYKPLDSKQLSVLSKLGKVQAGTPRYCSISVHAGGKCSRPDDIEGVGYCIWEKILLFKYKGVRKLPWSDVEGDKSGHDIKKMAVKTLIMGGEGYDNKVWTGLSKFFKYIVDVEYAEIPDYNKVREFFSEIEASIRMNVDDNDDEMDVEEIVDTKKEREAVANKSPPPTMTKKVVAKKSQPTTTKKKMETRATTKKKKKTRAMKKNAGLGVVKEVRKAKNAQRETKTKTKKELVIV